MDWARTCALALATLVFLAGSEAATRRFTVIGASLSDGFGVRLRTTLADGTKPVVSIGLADLLRAADIRSDLRVTTHATSTFFLAPELITQTSIDRAIRDKPTFILAVDVLFWSGYGSRSAEGEPILSCEDRAKRLSRALATLQPLVNANVPVVIGNLPNMRQAIEGGVLTDAMVPDLECLNRLNSMILAWASERPTVVILDLSDLVRRALAGIPIQACGRDWCEIDLGPLLQADRLHPTLNGLLAVLAAALEAADSCSARPVTESFDLDPARIRRRLRKEIHEIRTESRANVRFPSGSLGERHGTGDSSSSSGP